MDVAAGQDPRLFGSMDVYEEKTQGDGGADEVFLDAEYHARSGRGKARLGTVWTNGKHSRLCFIYVLLSPAYKASLE